MTGGLSRDELEAAVAAREWYHTIEVADGLETPGWFDLRETASRVPIPADLTGMRCLDVGTFDGFWAFEMEARGADEVVAVDVKDPKQWDWPATTPAHIIEQIARRHAGGGGFNLVKNARGSSVQREWMTVYEISEEGLGSFDVIYVGSLLIHLRDPVGALERIRQVCRGMMISVDTLDPWLSVRFPRRPIALLDGRDRPWWWRANIAAIRRMIEAAGFELTRPAERVLLQRGAGQPLAPVRPRVLRNRASREAFMSSRIGDPHLITHARPAI